MRLTELEPRFLKRLDDYNFKFVDSIQEADGVEFLCPKCWIANKGPVGTHMVICWSPSVPQTTRPIPGRWKLVGTGYHDLSLIAGSSSVLLTSGCRWHGFVTAGEVSGA